MGVVEQPDVDNLKRLFGPVFEASGCDFVILGGSLASNKAAWWSDVDIFIHVPNHDELTSVKTERLMKMLPELARISGLDNIDLHDLEELPVQVQFNIIRRYIILFEVDDGSARANFIERVLQEYWDVNPWYEAMLDERLKSLL